MNASLAEKIKAFQAIDCSTYGNTFLLTWEKSLQHIKATLLLTEIFNLMHQQGMSFRTFDSGLAISIFRDNSTRTRFSFASAANALGLAVSDLDEQKSQIAHGETVRETANMISFLADAIGIRDDMYLGEGNHYMRQVSKALDMGYSEGTLHQRPALINLQCDIDHPTQSMADMAKLRDYFGGMEQLKGKKIAMTWAYSPSYGKPLSVPQGIIGLMTRAGMDVTLAHPPGYSLIPDIPRLAETQAEESGGRFRIVDSMEEAFAEADVVYPKSWAPYSVMQQRTALLKKADKTGLNELEKQCLANNAQFKQWECTEERMKKTNAGKALYMHCLPADISGVNCKQGEVSKTVFDRYRTHTYQEAGYKPFVIAAMIFLARLNEPNAMLDRILKSHRNRIHI